MEELLELLQAYVAATEAGDTTRLEAARTGQLLLTHLRLEVEELARLAAKNNAQPGKTPPTEFPSALPGRFRRKALPGH